jgi:hypothetical protein
MHSKKNTQAAVTPDELVAQLRTALAKGEVERCETYYLSPSVLTQAVLTKEMLQAGSQMKVVRSYMCPGNLFVKSLISSFSNTVITPTEYRWDLRYGVVLYGKRDAEIFSLFLGRSKEGELNGHRVAVKGGLQEWLFKTARNDDTQ